FRRVLFRSRPLYSVHALATEPLVGVAKSASVFPQVLGLRGRLDDDRRDGLGLCADLAGVFWFLHQPLLGSCSLVERHRGDSFPCLSPLSEGEKGRGGGRLGKWRQKTGQRPSWTSVAGFSARPQAPVGDGKRNRGLADRCHRRLSGNLQRLFPRLPSLPI